MISCMEEYIARLSLIHRISRLSSRISSGRSDPAVAVVVVRGSYMGERGRLGESRSLVLCDETCLLFTVLLCRVDSVIFVVDKVEPGDQLPPSS